MFDVTTVKNSTTVKNKIQFNAVSGTLIKSTPQSRIIRFHKESDHAKTFFNIDSPYYKRRTTRNYVNDIGISSSYDSEHKIEIVVLQVMLCGGDEYLIEFLETETKEN